MCVLFTGKLTLGEINGPSDGMFLCMLFCIAGYLKPGFYTQTYADTVPFLAATPLAPYTMATFPLLVGYVGLALTIAGNCYMVSRKINPFGRPITKLFPFAVMAVLMWSWVLLQPEFFRAHARVYCLSMGLLFCQMICSLMVAHVCDEDYVLLRPALIPLILAYTNCVAGPAFLPKLFPVLSPHVCILLLLAAHFSLWFHFICNAILEISSLLGIRCFVITSKKDKDSAGTPFTQQHQPMPQPKASAPMPVTPAALMAMAAQAEKGATKQRKKSTQ
jgi:hypothetical protein